MRPRARSLRSRWVSASSAGGAGNQSAKERRTSRCSEAAAYASLHLTLGSNSYQIGIITQYLRCRNEGIAAAFSKRTDVAEGPPEPRFALASRAARRTTAG